MYIQGWNTNGSELIIQQPGSYFYPYGSYPFNNNIQSLAWQNSFSTNTQKITQNIFLNAGANIMTFYGGPRPGNNYNTANTFYITIGNNTILSNTSYAQNQGWTLFTLNFDISTSASYLLSIFNVGANSDTTISFANFVLTTPPKTGVLSVNINNNFNGFNIYNQNLENLQSINILPYETINLYSDGLNYCTNSNILHNNNTWNNTNNFNGDITVNGYTKLNDTNMNNLSINNIINTNNLSINSNLNAVGNNYLNNLFVTGSTIELNGFQCKGKIFANFGIQAGGLTTMNALQVDSTSNLSLLNVSGSTKLNSLNVSGSTSLQNTTVNGGLIAK